MTAQCCTDKPARPEAREGLRILVRKLGGDPDARDLYAEISRHLNWDRIEPARERVRKLRAQQSGRAPAFRWCG